MQRFKIGFDADPLHSNAPWSGRKNSAQRMMQSLTDYLKDRCGASNVRFLIVDVDEEAKEEEKPARRRRSAS